jgi:hypothetical protein
MYGSDARIFACETIHNRAGAVCAAVIDQDNFVICEIGLPDRFAQRSNGSLDLLLFVKGEDNKRNRGLAGSHSVTVIPILEDPDEKV